MSTGTPAPARPGSVIHPSSRPTPAPGPDPAPVAVRAAGVVKVHGRGPDAVRALDHVDLDLHLGRFTAIMGPSGSGKSTLLHVLAGLDRPTSGRIWLNGPQGPVDLAEQGEEQLSRLRRERLGFVFQAFNLLPTLTVAENVVLPLELAGRRPDPAWLAEVVGVVGLADRLRHRPAQLSGGQQQRVAVARALVGRPDVVFADEPTGNLDSRSGAEVLAFLRGAVDRYGQTVVMVTHDPLAAAHADRVVVLADGRLVDDLVRPTAAQILARLTGLGR